MSQAGRLVVVTGRLMPTKYEPPKNGGTSDAVNPNDGSGISDFNNSSGRTAMTSAEVPRRLWRVRKLCYHRRLGSLFLLDC